MVFTYGSGNLTFGDDDRIEWFINVLKRSASISDDTKRNKHGIDIVLYNINRITQYNPDGINDMIRKRINTSIESLARVYIP